ncbi:hypothetical protein KQ304_02495 [Synechococcus sp. CS-1329]|jgi:hypothetical protein|uniref:hypothetical protein n=1 Tax=Synechococcus sp. CS-1329 TaxID=2847975 RepID=UPI00223C4D12|nr:hypothetical protein [Synechococcus sp. CS-1329]MCT0217872.1 hypothetical protein [Synechococcus sp. CS-1329]
MSSLQRILQTAVLAAALLLIALAAGPGPANAGPVNWQEVPENPAGRQWWDTGSLRLSRGGDLSVLTRFQPASEEDRSQLYVMEIDCGQGLFRDTSVNGLPRFKPEWQPSGGDDLISAVLEEACAAGSELLASR